MLKFNLRTSTESNLIPILKKILIDIRRKNKKEISRFHPHNENKARMRDFEFDFPISYNFIE